LELLALLDKKEDIILLVERAKSLGDVDFLRRLTLLQYDASYVSDEEAERNFSTLIRTSLEEAQTIAE
jgi:hypothetical protein